MTRSMEYCGLTTNAVRIACYDIAALGIDHGIERPKLDEVDVACRESLHAGEGVWSGDIVPRSAVHAGPRQHWQWSSLWRIETYADIGIGEM